MWNKNVCMKNGPLIVKVVTSLIHGGRVISLSVKIWQQLITETTVSLTEFLSLNTRNRTQRNVIGNNRKLKLQNLSNAV